jgi:hypothetical protein
MILRPLLQRTTRNGRTALAGSLLVIAVFCFASLPAHAQVLKCASTLRDRYALKPGDRQLHAAVTNEHGESVLGRNFARLFADVWRS